MTFSYHSVYKALQLLIKDDVLIKSEKQYIINNKWIDEKIKYAQKLSKHTNESNSLPSNLSSSLIEFNNIEDAYEYLRKFEKNNLDVFNKDKNETIIWLTYHCYNFLLQPAIEFNHIKKIKSHNNDFIILNYGDTPLDKLTKKSYEKFGASMIPGCKIGGISEINIYNNYAIQIFYGKKFRRILDDAYSSAKNINDVDISSLYDKLNNEDYKIYISIYRDDEIVRCFRSLALEVFKENYGKNESMKKLDVFFSKAINEKIKAESLKSKDNSKQIPLSMED